MVNINSLERDGLRQAELCPRHTMNMKTKKKIEKNGDLDRMCFVVCFIALRPQSTAMVILGQSGSLITLFLGKLRPPTQKDKSN